MKHPGPWKYDDDTWQIEDAKGETVVCDVGVRTAETLIEIEKERAELLEALGKVLAGEPGARSEAQKLIARIEKGTHT